MRRLRRTSVRHAPFVVVAAVAFAVALGGLNVAGTASAAAPQARITSVAPNPFSPNHDGHNDVTAFHLSLPSPAQVTFTIENVNRQRIQGPHTPHGLVGKGDHVYHWDGKNNHGKVAGNGKYTIVVLTSTTVGRITTDAVIDASVTVHNTAPKPPTTTTRPAPTTTTQPRTAPPAEATARCNDGTYSYALHHQGACSHHGGVVVFYN